VKEDDGMTTVTIDHLDLEFLKSELVSAETEAERLMARIAELEAGLASMDANLTHFLKRNPQQVMLPETVEFVRDMARRALAKEPTE
jgi:uncharacterized protein involved in exopolysaccharide biosynthesis